MEPAGGQNQTGQVPLGDGPPAPALRPTPAGLPWARSRAHGETERLFARGSEGRDQLRAEGTGHGAQPFPKAPPLFLNYVTLKPSFIFLSFAKDTGVRSLSQLEMAGE